MPDVLVYEATVLIGAIDDDGAACGVLAASEQPYGDNGEKVMNLLYLYVHPDYRSKGAGTKMLSLLTEYAQDKDFTGIQTQYPASGERMTLWTFLANKGFGAVTDEADETQYRFPLLCLKDKLVSKTIKTREKLVFLEDMSKTQWSMLRHYVDKMQKKDSGFLLLLRKAYSQKYTCVAFDKEEVSGCVMVTISGNGDIELKKIFCDGENTRLLARMLSEVGKRISADQGDEAIISFIPTPTSKSITALLLKEGVERNDLAYQMISF
ncbi:MAG: GNAT family N-acetyltransferase [Butyrivibrio sp.]|nr:GNAT family N-acetyltransferase [Butyrivibrio sp.]